MIEFLVVVVMAVVVSFYLAGMHEGRKQGLQKWQRIAADLGLHFSGREPERLIEGKLLGVAVQAEFRRKQVGKQQQETTRLRAGGDGSIPLSLVVREDTLGRKLGRLIDGQDEQIGHKGFDAAIELPSMDAYGCAALSCEARQQLLKLIGIEGEVRGGQVLWSKTAAYSQEEWGWLQARLQFFAHLARLLTVTRDSLHPRLAQNAQKDPSRGVRLRNLRFLVDPNTHTPPALLAATARALLSDADAAVRLLAAQQLAEPGHAVLAALASNTSEETALRVQALRALDEAGAAALPMLVSQLLSDPAPELVCAALAISGARRLDQLAPAVLACAGGPHEAVRAAVATALGQLRTEAGEQTLLGLLTDSSIEVQIASAEALGEAGSVVSVEPLLRVAESMGRAPLRRAARAAIGRIQSQLGNVEAGSLSLAEDQELAGALALAETAAVRVGEVSLAQEAAPALQQSHSEPATSNDRRSR